MSSRSINPGILNELPATTLSRLLATGQCSAIEIAEACLRRVDAREAEVKAWAYIDPEYVLRQARARDGESPRGPLHGIPVGIKDIINTSDMLTQFGSPVYRAHQPVNDASCVSILREAGCVIMGKTETMEFAVCHPARTCNPENLAHTPGGSSSGSAAAVADCMCPLGLGTQTGASVIRPASYCGVVGFKASYGLINRAGIKSTSETLDTVGFLTRTVGDASLLASVLIGWEYSGIFNKYDNIRVGICHSSYWASADAGTIPMILNAGESLREAGCDVSEVSLPRPCDLATEAQATINLYESFRSYSYERSNFPDQISKSLSARFEKGKGISLEAYLSAQQVLSECRLKMSLLFKDFDVLIEPSAPGEAPYGIDNAGDAIFSRMWTALHLPCVSIPVLKGPSGLPVGLQIIGPMHSDKRTLEIADQIHRMFA
jgi:Asp-tRNA(Asn)/Glu-tRNA(Gln) amidotransferase A subunit family amidase